MLCLGLFFSGDLVRSIKDSTSVCKKKISDTNQYHHRTSVLGPYVRARGGVG